MPRYDHPNLGEVVKTEFHPGVLVKFNKDEDGIKTGLCTVRIYGVLYCNIPLFYHCKGHSGLSSNGSLEEAFKAFNVGDEILVQVIGHLSDRVPCSDEEVCDDLEGAKRDSAGQVSPPAGGISGVLPDGGSENLRANCDERTSLQLSCGPPGSRGGTRTIPEDHDGTVEECEFDYNSKETCEILQGTGAGCSEGNFYNLRLGRNTDSTAPESESECFTADYEPQCDCPRDSEGYLDCTPGEVLCSQELANGLTVDTICPSAGTDLNNGDCTTDGEALQITGPAGNEIEAGDSFDFTSNANGDCPTIWSTPDGGGEGTSLEYFTEDSNSDCVQDFTVCATIVDSNGSTQQHCIDISVKEVTSGGQDAYRSPGTLDGFAVNSAVFNRSVRDCIGITQSSTTDSVTSSNCVGDPDCCTVESGASHGCSGPTWCIASGCCCSSDSDAVIADEEEQCAYDNCVVFAPAWITGVCDLRTSTLKDQGCCPNALFGGAPACL